MSIETWEEHAPTDPWEEEPSEEHQGAEWHRPAKTDAEQVLLGSAMQKPELIDELAEVFHPDDFTVPVYRYTWYAIDDLRQQIPHGEISPFAVGDKLRAWRADGTMPVPPLDSAALSQLYSAGVLAASADYYAQKVTEAAEASRIIDLGLRAQQLGFRPDFTTLDTVADLQQQLDGIVRGTAAHAPDRIGSLLDGALERAVTPPTIGDRVPTGLMDLDSLTGGGFAPGRFIVIGARPAMGKTTMATSVARAAALTSRVPTLLASLEMGSDEITLGILSAEARVPLHHIVNGIVDEAGVKALKRTAERINDAPLFIDDTPSVSLPSLRGQVRHLVRTQGLRLLIVDYLQLMQAPRAESRQLAVSQMSRGLKLLAKEFGIAVVVLSQLNRGPEQRTDKKPQVSDLRESGSLEQDSDMVILLHRDDAYDKESPRSGEIDVIVGKHRAGPTATITAAFQGHYARLVDMAVT